MTGEGDRIVGFDTCDIAKRGYNRTARIYHRSPPSDWEGKCCSISLKSSRACSGVGSVDDISCSGEEKIDFEAVELSPFGVAYRRWGVLEGQKRRVSKRRK